MRWLPAALLAGFLACSAANIGPMPNGEIQDEFVTRLRTVGEWLSRYGEAIYGTRGGPIPPGDWGVTTRKGDHVYVHVLHWTAPLLALPPIENVNTARMLLDGSPVEFTQSSSGVVLKIAAATKGEVDGVVVLTLGRNR